MMLLRKILFLALTAIYIITCPLLIMYALGYIYSPAEKEFVQTGLIHLSTVPAGAEIYLEDSRYTNRTPATIGGLLEGNYRVALYKQGYKIWSQFVSVEGGKAAAFDDILLIPQEWPRKAITNFACKELIPAENGTFFAAMDTKLGDYQLYDKRGQPLDLPAVETPLADVTVTKIYKVNKSSSYLFNLGTLLDKKCLFMNTEDKENGLRDITKLTGDKFSSIEWNPDDPAKLYTHEKGCINKIDIEKRQSFACFLEKIKGFGISGDWLYVIDNNDAVVRYRSDKQKKENLSLDTQTAKRLFERSVFYNITVKDSVIFFLGSKGDFVASTPPYFIAYEGVTGADFQPRSGKLLYWGKKVIGVVQSSGKGQKMIFQEKFTVQNILENGADIKQAFWVYDDRHIIYNDGGKIYLVEIEPQGPNHTEFVVKVRDNTDVYYDDDSSILFYIDEASGNLMRLQIIPEGELTKILKKVEGHGNP